MTVMKEVKLQPQPPSTILTVDLGERYVATSVVFAKGAMRNPRFYGKQVRGIRRHCLSHLPADIFNKSSSWGQT